MVPFVVVGVLCAKLMWVRFDAYRSSKTSEASNANMTDEELKEWGNPIRRLPREQEKFLENNGSVSVNNSDN